MIFNFYRSFFARFFEKRKISKKLLIFLKNFKFFSTIFKDHSNYQALERTDFETDNCYGL